jgi:O-acetyl-ADP-ribose deacetylase (regulator of RNase III)
MLPRVAAAVRIRYTGSMEVTIIRGDIVEQDVDAVVNAANSGLMGGGGVDGAILRAGGASQREARRELVQRIGSLPTGRAAASNAGDMTARWVIHVVGPVHSRSEDRTELLASCYREALAVADELGARSVAFPAVSAGISGWPMADAADVAVRTVLRTPTRVEEVRFVLFDDDALAQFQRARRAEATPPDVIELADVGAALHRHDVAQVDALHRAIEDSRTYLRPWMPWADQSRADTAAFLERAADEWVTARSYGYVIIDAADGSILGGAGLHDRLGPHALEIGYWRRADAGGRGVVTAAANALTAAALAMPGVEWVEIHCDAANVASAAVARRAGFVLNRIEDKATTAPGEHGRSMIWVRRR